MSLYVYVHIFMVVFMFSFMLLFRYVCSHSSFQCVFFCVFMSTLGMALVRLEPPFFCVFEASDFSFSQGWLYGEGI